VSAEKNVLACVLGEVVSPNQLDLEPDDFTEIEMHSKLYELMIKRWDKGLPVSTESISKYLLKESNPEIDFQYVMSLGDRGAIGLNIERYILEMRKASQRRKLISKLRVISHELEQGKTDAYQASVEMVGAASNISDLSTTSMNEAADALIDDLVAVAEGTKLAYMPSGIPEWDDDPNFVGVSRLGTSIFMGRSGAGKTTLLNTMAMGMLAKGLKVYVHGVETTIQRRLSDMAMSRAAVPGRKWALLTRELSEIRAQGDNDLDIAADVAAWYDRIAEQVDWLRAKPLTITGTGLTVEQICAKARQLHAQGRVDCIIIDYLQAIHDSNGLGVRLGDRVQQTAHKSVMLSELASDLGIPVLLGAQVSGEKEGKAPAPPEMHSVQFSSVAHQSAEECYGLHRPDYYRERDPHSDVKGPSGVIQIVARKRRTGTLSTLNLKWSGETKFVGDRRRVEFAAPVNARLRVVD
jgi:replicative DNA helicase